MSRHDLSKRESDAAAMLGCALLALIVVAAILFAILGGLGWIHHHLTVTPEGMQR